jgi:tRNA-modifying protein YgfZ
MAGADLSYGDVTGEYLALRNDAATVSGMHEAVVVTGRDAVTFLNGILTQDVEGTPSGGVARSMLLNPKGKVRALLWMLRAEEQVVLIADHETGDKVAESLARYRIRVDVQIGRPVPVVEVWGPDAERALADLGYAPPDGWQRIGEVIIARVPLADVPRFMLVGEVDTTKLRPAGAVAATAVRVEAGEPLTRRDLDDRTLVHETGLDIESVSYSKGCYLGQEVVARIEHRGHVNRTLRGITLATNVLPPEGTTLWSDGREVGRLTSVCESLSLRAPAGLSLIRVNVGDTVEVVWEEGRASARVHDLPMFTDL